ncbi:MAG: SUMF1/EgtB/PvdO family nonheme iron enzyme [Saprospiraceae bacterium]|nr:SUMF1/EgtB/PvdO family nonheme iron enzyme [Saprospiraceae bacterium]
MKKKTPAIFINYRRALSTLEARLLYLMLQARFPGEVFLDEAVLEGGDRWRDELRVCIENSRVMISLIPDGWVQHLDKSQLKSKLYFDEKCHVRHEIHTAIKAGKTIIPILVNGAAQPKKEQLPDAISELFDTFNNGQKLDFRRDPNVANFEKFFAQIAKKAGLEQIKEENRSVNLFQRPLAEEFPLPQDMRDFLPAAECPFVGLKPFQRQDARLFFGRSREIYTLCHKITREPAPRVLLLDGYSGTGKSSLLQAGLIPRIENQGWGVAYDRRENDKVGGLKAVFGRMLDKAAAGAPARQLLILDQVEEAITDRIEGLPRELEELVAALKDALKKYPDYKFILGFRSEQTARIAKALLDENIDFDDRNTLFPLERTGAEEAISGVASDPLLGEKKYKITFQPADLPRRIAEKLLGGRDNAHIAPLLQVNMELLWQRCRLPDGSVPVTAHALENFIEKQEDLLDHYFKKIREKISEDRADNRKILQLLRFYVQDEPASATRLETEFEGHENFKDDPVFAELQRELKKHYLLSSVTSKEQAAARLSHDVLAGVIHEQYQSLTETRLQETSAGLFDALKKDLDGQIYQLNYAGATDTLTQMFQLGVRREELRPYLQELLFFWNECGRKPEIEKILLLWLESNLLSAALLGGARQLAPAYDKAALRNWLQRAAPGLYADLCKKYLAPSETVMVEIPGGRLTIGEDKEKRLAEVRTFRLSNVPTTWWKYGLYLFAQGQEKQLEEKAPNWGINGDHPMVRVSWYEAVEYCNWLSEAMGLEKVYDIKKEVSDSYNNNKEDNIKWLVTPDFKANGFRLPTEIEWEYAARGGQQSKGFVYAGSNKLDEVGWYHDNSNGKTHPVAEKNKANELGLYDMSGNVWDWCGDWYGEYPPTLPVGFAGPESGAGRVLRGGSWDYNDISCRVAFRGRSNPYFRNYFVGVRLAQGYAYP